MMMTILLATVAVRADESESLESLPRLILPDPDEDRERLGFTDLEVMPELILRLKPRRTLIGKQHFDGIETALEGTGRCARSGSEMTISFDAVEWISGGEILPDLTFLDAHERSDTLRRDLHIEYRARLLILHPGGGITVFQHDLDLDAEAIELASPRAQVSLVTIDPTTVKWRKNAESTSRREISTITIELSQTPPERDRSELDPRALHQQLEATAAPDSELVWLVWKPAHFTGKPLILAKIQYEKANGDRLAWSSENFHRETQKTLNLGLREALWTAR